MTVPRIALAASLMAAAMAAGQALAASATVTNASVTTRCAEHDNVDLRLSGPGISRFRLEATQPVYGAEIMVDSTAPDWRDCPMENHGAADFRFTPRSVTLFENARLRLVGLTFDRFWRRESTPVRVGDRTENDLHLVQLFWKVTPGPAAPDGVEEVVAMYPTDGYWRLRPLPLPQLQDSVYGSSALIGPVEERGRPIVDLASVTFDPATLGFEIGFRRGGSARLTFTAPDRTRLAAEVTLDPALAADRTFAAVRSMYVNRWRADAAELAWRAAPDAAWVSEPIMGLAVIEAEQVRLTRETISMHNTSAPDLLLGGFR